MNKKTEISEEISVCERGLKHEIQYGYLQALLK